MPPHTDIQPQNANILNGNAPDLLVECSRYEEKIKQYGGIKLFLAGIGPDGHIARRGRAEVLAAVLRWAPSAGPEQPLPQPGAEPGTLGAIHHLGWRDDQTLVTAACADMSVVAWSVVLSGRTTASEARAAAAAEVVQEETPMSKRPRNSAV